MKNIGSRVEKGNKKRKSQKIRRRIRNRMIGCGGVCLIFILFLTCAIFQEHCFAEETSVPRDVASLPIISSEQELKEDNAFPAGLAVDDAAADRMVPVVFDDTDLVIIDPGHGGEDEGCQRDGVLEKEINLQIALALRDRLTEMGYEVLLTRSEDTYVSLEERILMANTSGADIFVSIHQNAYEGEEASGIETWVCGGWESSEDGLTAEQAVSLEWRENNVRLGKLLHSYTVEAAEAKNRGLHEKGEELKVLRESNITACLIETGFLSNDEERALLKDPEYQAKIVKGLARGIDLYFHPKTMYLTFDDGPSAEHTTTILDILKKKNVKATFFVIGENVRKYPEIARRIVEEGHTIGIHCDNHDYDGLYESVESYLLDFQAAYDTVYEVTGVESQLFRFPGGSINSYNKDVYKEIIKEMTEKGFVYFDWNASLEDAVRKNQKSSPEQLIINAKESTLGRKRVVLLAHDIVNNTTLILEDLIEGFPEYHMEPLTASVEPIQFKQ